MDRTQTSQFSERTRLPSRGSSQQGKKDAKVVKVKPPPVQEPIFLNFAHLTKDRIAELAGCASKDDIKRILADSLGIDQDEGMRLDIIADMYYHLHAFCKAQGFGAEKTSTLLSITKYLHEGCVEQRLSMEEAYDEFKRLLLKHCVDRPPRSIGVFTFEDSKAVIEYMHDTFFRHYKMYCYVYLTQCNLKLSLERDPAALQPISVGPVCMEAEEVDPREQEELNFLFADERQKAAAAAREAKLREGEEGRAAMVKRRVEEEIAKLMEEFEKQLSEQDARFKEQLEGK